MKKVLITHPILENGINILRDAGFEIVLMKKCDNSAKQILKEIKKHSPDALLSFLTDDINSELIKNSSSVKIISNYAVG